MPLCPCCGGEISEEALACPNLGHPNERGTAIPEVEFTPADPNAVRELAGFWIRFAALLIDVILVLIVTAPFARTVDVGQQHLRVVYNPYASPVLFFYGWLMIGL